jgi:putative inorganic carbon (HCO3(-)) transporter
MRSRLESITYTLFLFLTPLLVTSFSKELFEFPKTNFLYLITGVIIFVAGWNLKINLIYKKQKLLIYPLFLIFVAAFISFLFSGSYYTSLFGYYTRFNGGLVSLFCIFVWVIFLINKHLDKKNVEHSIYILLLSGLLVSAYAILQKFGVDKSLWSDDSTKRVFSTLGQPNWLAAYLIPIFYIALYLGNKIKGNIFVKLIPVVVVYIAIIFTYSISGFLALLISVVLYGILNSKELKIYFKKYWIALLILLLISCALAIPLRDRISEQVKNMYGIIGLLETEKAENLPVNYGDTGKIRLILWDGTIKLIFSSPKQFLIGSGPETFAYVFPKFRPDSINATSEANFVHNKPHNWYLEIFANLGLFGFLAYLSFIGAVIYLFIKSKKTHLSKALFCGWISILITNFFGWPTLPLSILFYIIPVFINFELFSQMPEEKEDVGIIPVTIKFFFIFLIANFLIFSPIILTTADYFFKTGDYAMAHRVNPLEPRYELFEITSGRKLDTKYVREFYYRNANNPYVVKTLMNYLEHATVNGKTPAAIIMLRNEIKEDAAKHSPNDLDFRFNEK